MKLFVPAFYTYLFLALVNADSSSEGTSALRGGTSNAESGQRALGDDRDDSDDHRRDRDYEYYKGYAGKACRDEHDGYGDEGSDYDKYYDYSLERCMDKCTDSSRCEMFEYDDDDNRCEIWYRYYGNYETKHGYYCFYKG